MRAAVTWVRAIFTRSRPASLLRQLVDEDAFRASAEGATRELLNAALLVRRAGLEHLVGEATQAEVEALAHAGETIAQERNVDLLAKLRDPAHALEPFDGGAALRRETLDLAKRLARGDA